MKRNKIISILEYSARNKILVGILAVSLIGAGGVFLSSNAAISNNTIGINKTVLAGILNNDGNKACVINGNANLVLHTSASNSNIQSYISVGEMLTINSYSNGYYNVTVQETGATGYIASSNMQKIVSGVGYDLTSLSGTGYVTNVSTVVNLRENATMNSETLAKLKNNTSVTLLGKQGDWYKVNDNGTTGYIYGEYIAIANATMNSETLAKLKNNTSVTLLGKQGDWYKVNDNGTTGYIYGEYIAIANSNTTSSSSSNSSTVTSSNTSKTTGTTKSNSSSSIKTTSSNSNTGTTGTTSKTESSSNQTSKIAYVYDLAGNGEVGVYSVPASAQTAASDLQTTLESGTKITVLGSETSNGYYKIEYGNNTIGYIPARYVSFTKPESSSSSNSKTTGTTTKSTSGTTSSTGNSSSSSSGITIGSSTSDSTLFSDNYQELYYSICTGLNLESLPGPELVTNLDNYITINRQNYYYVYTPTIDDYNMGGIPMDSANGNFSQIGTGEYVNAKGVELPESDYSLISTATHSENINNLSDNEIIAQLSRITSEYINCYVARGSVIENGRCSGPYANMNNNAQTVTVNLNAYKVFNGEKAYSVTVNSKDNAQLYVALNGYIYIATENEFANVSNAPHLTQKQWKQDIKGI